MSEDSGKTKKSARDRRKPAADPGDGGASWAVIRRLMSDRGWILQELIRRSGITRTTFFNIQHGKSKGSYETFLKIAKAFGVECDVVLGRAPYPEGIRDGLGFAGALPRTRRACAWGASPTSACRS
jgi:transcriptional regulator with XRE-family HTH domain